MDSATPSVNHKKMFEGQKKQSDTDEAAKAKEEPKKQMTKAEAHKLAL